MRPWTWLTIRLLVENNRVAKHVHQQVIEVLEKKVVRWALRLHLQGQYDLSPVLEQSVEDDR